MTNKEKALELIETNAEKGFGMSVIRTIYAKEAVELASTPDWISVEDRLPDNETDVLVYDSELGMQFIAFWRNELNCWETDMHIEISSLSHWMPLPEAPKQ